MCFMSKKEQIEELLSRGVEDVVIRQELEEKLLGDKKLRVKFGIDPTGSKIHIGHAVVYWKLRAFQDLGHKVIILIGDYTAMIGDASDKESERQTLSVDEVKENMKAYLDQIGKIVDLDKAEIRYNSEWLKKLSFLDLLGLAGEFKVAQMLERDNFRKRFESNQPIGLQEFLYPMMQGYDSVALEADVELGGSEQLFNMMAGRVLQKRSGQIPQAVMTFELLTGTNGKKMSKTQPNCVFIEDEPAEMYGKIMSLPDELIVHYFKLATEVPLDVIEQIEFDMTQGANPRDSKAFLARSIVTRYHSQKSAEVAEQSWNEQFREGGTPEDIEEVALQPDKDQDFVAVISAIFEVSRSEVRRLIEQNGVKINGELATADTYTPVEDDIIQVGKRRYKRIKLKK